MQSIALLQTMQVVLRSWAKIQIQAHMMARILNLPAFLKANGEPDFAAKMIDDILPENNLTVVKGEATTMTIGEFTTKIFLKQPVIIRENI